MTNQFELAVRAGTQAGRTFCSGKLQPVAFIIRSTPAMHPVCHIHMLQDDHASCSHCIPNRTDNLINKLQYPSLSLSLSILLSGGTDQLQWVLSVLWQKKRFVRSILWASLMRLMGGIVRAAIKCLVSALWGTVSAS